MTRVAINGFGRIGRLVARAILERPDCGLELVSVNDLADAKSNAWLFSRDSVHGKYPGKVETDGLLPTLDYSKTGAIPTRQTRILKPDATVEGGLAQVQDLAADDFAIEYQK